MSPTSMRTLGSGYRWEWRQGWPRPPAWTVAPMSGVGAGVAVGSGGGLGEAVCAGSEAQASDRGSVAANSSRARIFIGSLMQCRIGGLPKSTLYGTGTADIVPRETVFILPAIRRWWTIRLATSSRRSPWSM